MKYLIIALILCSCGKNKDVAHVEGEVYLVKTIERNLVKCTTWCMWGATRINGKIVIEQFSNNTFKLYRSNDDTLQVNQASGVYNGDTFTILESECDNSGTFTDASYQEIEDTIDQLALSKYEKGCW